MKNLEKHLASKCPTCGEPAKPIKNNPNWYYCHNPSCNRTAFEYTKSCKTCAGTGTIPINSMFRDYIPCPDCQSK